jgi:hypothetical protein
MREPTAILGHSERGSGTMNRGERETGGLVVEGRFVRKTMKTVSSASRERSEDLAGREWTHITLTGAHSWSCWSLRRAATLALTAIPNELRTHPDKSP